MTRKYLKKYEFWKTHAVALQSDLNNIYDWCKINNLKLIWINMYHYFFQSKKRTYFSAVFLK